MTRVSILPYLTLGVFFCALSGPVYAAAPSNDEFANRLAVAGGRASGTKSKATVEAPETSTSPIPSESLLPTSSTRLTGVMT